MSTKRELRHRIGKLEKALAALSKEHVAVKKQLQHAAKWQEAWERLKRKHRRVKARHEQTIDQIEALEETILLLRSELRSNIHVTQLRGAVASAKIKEVEQLIPNAGRVGTAMVYEDEQERGRTREKRFGVKG